jgi:hypothetical protein
MMALAAPVFGSREELTWSLWRGDSRSVQALLEATPGVAAVVDLGDAILVKAATTPDGFEPLPEVAPGQNLYIAQHLHPNEAPGVVVFHSGLFCLFSASAGLESRDHAWVVPLDELGSRVLARRATSKAKLAPAAYQLADQVDGERWLATVRSLADIGTRFVGTAGSLQARDLIAAEFSALGLTVSTPSFPTSNGISYNVVGELRGTATPDDLYIVCGHYDSISEQPSVLAPGAEDNASGTAGVIELARVFAATPPRSTILFVAFGAEELGFYGSRDFVDGLVAAGRTGNVKAVINMDMIGYSSDTDYDVLLETGSVGVGVQTALEQAASAVTDLRVVLSLHPFGSDHVPFLQEGMPAVLTIQNDWAEYPDYHRSTDTIGNVRLAMGQPILRMNAAALATLAGDVATSVQVTSPNEGERFRGGFPVQVAWTAGSEVDSIDLHYSLDGGATYAAIASGLAPAAGEFTWYPPVGVASAEVTIRVTGHTDGLVDSCDLSDEYATLIAGAGPVIDKVKYRGGEDRRLVLKGAFVSGSARIEVDGVALAQVEALADHFVDGAQEKLTGRDPHLKQLLPKGKSVVVRVVDTATGLTTGEYSFTR